jgi:hydrogenase-4 component E
MTVRVFLFILITMLLKGAVFPWLLFHAIREASIRREIEPFVGYTKSILIGIIAIIVSMWIVSRLPLHELVQSPFVISIALFTMMVGLFIIVARKIALNQVLGYLVLENGIVILGNALFQKIPLIVEMGVLLDIFVAVFVMGIAIYRIHKEFDHIDVSHFDILKG